LFGLLVDGQFSSDPGFRPSGWRTDVRAGTEVMSKQDEL
jgi:hypothetical protein